MCGGGARRRLAGGSLAGLKLGGQKCGGQNCVYQICFYQICFYLEYLVRLLWVCAVRHGEGWRTERGSTLRRHAQPARHERRRIRHEGR